MVATATLGGLAIFAGALGALFGANKIKEGAQALKNTIERNKNIYKDTWESIQEQKTTENQADAAAEEENNQEDKATVFPTASANGEQNNQEDNQNNDGLAIGNATNEEESINASGQTPNANDWYEQWKTDRNETWAREDAIRAEQYERDDTAYQRMIDDMRKAGINPNLVGGTPISSNGSVSTAETQGGAAQSGYGTDMNAALTKVTQELQQQGISQDGILKILSILAMGLAKGG